MSSLYDDIIHLSRPHYPDLPPMPMEKRAAQFSPFAALVGYGDVLAETARLTESRRELTEDEITELNKTLNELFDNLDRHYEVDLTYFVPDKKKSGGSYVKKKGVVRIYDEYSRELVFFDRTRLSVDDIMEIKINKDKQG